MQHQKTDIEEALAKAQTEHITKCALENEISLTELDEILQPIIDSCTKDSIANGNYFTSSLLKVYLFILIILKKKQFKSSIIKCQILNSSRAF